MEIHDLVAGKYASVREKDLRLARWLIRNGRLQKTRLITRARKLSTTPGRRTYILSQIESDFGVTNDSTK